MDVDKFWYLLVMIAVNIVVFKFWFLKSLKDLMHIIRLRKSGIKSKGHVKAFLVSTNVDGLKSYHSVIEYRTPEGQNLEFDDRFSHKEKPIIGQEVGILYDALGSKNIIVDSQRNFESQVMLFCIATATAAMAIFIFLLLVK